MTEDLNTLVGEAAAEMHEMEVGILTMPGSPFSVANLNWYEFCNKFRGLSILDTSQLDINPLFGAQLVLVDQISTSNASRIMCTDSRISAPIINGAETCDLHTKSALDKQYNGLMITSNIMKDGSNFMLISYVPFNFKNKKIWAMAKNNRVFCVGDNKSFEPIDTIESPSNDVRDDSSSLTDRDFILISSKVTKSLGAEWNNVGEVVAGTWEIINNTIDPNYIRKMLELNMLVSYPDMDI